MMLDDPASSTYLPTCVKVANGAIACQEGIDKSKAGKYKEDATLGTRS
jgi:hypothetical protein